MADVIEVPLGSLLSGRQKFLLLNTLMLCAFMSALDTSIVATATPRILSDLGGFKLVSWIFTIYLLGSTIVLPIVGKLSDIFGRRIFLLAGLVIFVGSSALCGAAPSMPLLIVARGIQGLGGGILTGVIFTTLGDLFTPIERARYMGYTTSAWTLAALVGPTVGGFLTDGPGWRWCFYINLPVGIAAMALIIAKMPKVRRGGRIGDIDFAGSALLSSATICLLLALAWANEEFGWTSPITVGLLAAAVALGVSFFLNERGRANAIFPISLFRNRSLMQSNSMSFIQSIGMFGAVQYLPTFVQVSLGASATASGLVSTPQSLGLLFMCLIGGAFMSRTGRFRYMMIAGGVLVAVAAFALHGISVGEPEWHIAALMVVLGFGQGLIGPANAVIVQASVTHDQMGVATSSRQFSQQIGQVLGVAVLGLIFTTTYSSAFSSAVPQAIRSEITQDAYRQMEDPTVSLDKTSAARIREEALKAGASATVVDQTFRAQKDAVATAIDRVFLVATGAGLALLALAATTREIVLSDSFTVTSTEREPASALMH
jgi:EmrB/QacA subfamily drug resistance transporter